MDHLSPSESGEEKVPGSEDGYLLYEQRDLIKRKKGVSPPYEVIFNEQVGRHMVASRDISPGEILFKEAPLVFGPTDATSALCLSCYKPIQTEKHHNCEQCVFPMCSETCSKQAKEHQTLECALFQKRGFKFDAGKDSSDETEEKSKRCSYYSVITPIRAFAMRKRNPEHWKLIWSHMSHDEARKKSKYWRERSEREISRMKEMIDLHNQDDIRAMEILLGILLVNTFEIGVNEGGGDGGGDGKSSSSSSSSKTNVLSGYSSRDDSIQGLFALASMPSHSCVANTTHDFSSRETGYQMTLRSVLPIPKGSDITHSYTEPLDNVLYRKGLLKLGKFFDCHCQRCSDPTEMGTFTSALRCSSGKCKGSVVSTDVSKMDAKWKCDKCGRQMTCDQVQSVIQEVQRAGDRLDGDHADAGVDDYERFLARYDDVVLHPNHVLLLDRKYTLAKMYGRMSGFEADALTDEQFRRKRDLCQQVLNVLDKIMPGRTRKRGMMMYELHLPLVMLSNRMLQKGPGGQGVDPNRIKRDLKSGLEHLRAGLDILGDEPEDSFERKIVQGSTESVKQLEDWVKTVHENVH